MHLVFDLDGTLIDSRPGIQASLEAAVKSACPHLDVSQLRFTIGPRIREILRTAIPQASDSEMNAMETAFRASYDGEGWKRALVYPGVEKTLKELLERKHMLYIFTNKPKLPTSHLLEHLELRAYFRDVISSDSHKPPFISKFAMLSCLMNKYALSHNHMVCIGDSEDDLLAARECKINFIGIEYGYGTLPSKEKPLRNLRSFPEILLAL